MNRDKTYLLKELAKTIDESDSTAAFCLCQRWILKDALFLLKEQEPRAPYYTRLKYRVNGREVEVNLPECPRCFDNGLLLWDAGIEKGQTYCKRCGQAVKWDEDQ